MGRSEKPARLSPGADADAVLYKVAEAPEPLELFAAACPLVPLSSSAMVVRPVDDLDRREYTRISPDKNLQVGKSRFPWDVSVSFASFPCWPSSLCLDSYPLAVQLLLPNTWEKTQHSRENRNLASLKLESQGPRPSEELCRKLRCLSKHCFDRKGCPSSAECAHGIGGNLGASTWRPSSGQAAPLPCGEHQLASLESSLDDVILGQLKITALPQPDN